MILNLLRLSILILAGFSAVSSVTGLGAVFKGAFYPVIIAGCGIELGRYALVAYAVQQRDTLSLGWLWSIGAVVLGISLLTNAGIFGYLGNSIQNSHSKVKKTELDLSSLTVEKTRLEARIAAIDVQISELPKESINGRIKLMTAFAAERKEVSDNLKQITSRLSEVQANNIENLDDLGPVVYLAQTFGTSVENAVGNMMLAFTLSLDAFALFLTVLINLHHPKKVVAEVVKPTEVAKEPEMVIPTIKDWNFK